ncbi:MAG: bacteriohemerythrin [Gammaproteobacteria bacterium]|nr:bacteriohemerythrin [Gammaproteobacteria bacterium]
MSMLYIWNDSLSTGIRSIDRQHRGIIDLINQLHYAIKADDRKAITNILDDLIHYTASHFSFEEELQKKHNYPSFDAHKRKHDDFISRIENYKKMHDEGKDIAKKLSGELILWLTSHIKTEDQDYIPYCNKPLKQGWLNKMMDNFFS